VGGGLVTTRPLRPLEAVRAFGVMLGGSIALAAAAAARIVAVARAVLSLRRPSPLALVGTAATALYALVIRPWHLRWGAEPGDEQRELPGDELPEGGTQILHAVTIEAPVEEVWPWLAQLGQAERDCVTTGQRRSASAWETARDRGDATSARGVIPGRRWPR
jgi:hypothetical protein